MATLSEILKGKISKDGFSKAYVARELNVTERTIEYYMDGKREPGLEGLVKLSVLLGFQLNELTEQNVRPQFSNTESKKQRRENNDINNYIALLESNDKFFKHEYAQMLLSLKELIGLSKKQEALLKLNLQHVGTVEALQKGVDEDVVQEQINNQIAEYAAFDEMGNDVDN